jgi:hypothetical protein
VCKSIDFAFHVAELVEGSTSRARLLDLTAGDQSKPLNKKALSALLTPVFKGVLSGVRAVVGLSPDETAANFIEHFDDIPVADLRGASLWLNEFDSRVLRANSCSEQR